MSAKVDYSSFTALKKRLERASTTLQKELVQNLHQAGPVIEADMKGAASTKIQNRAASTVNVARIADGIQVVGGGTGGLGGALFAGGEFGGKKRKPIRYVNRSRSGTAYVVRRRTTQQFLPHNGNTGTFYWPTMRNHLPRLFKVQQKTLEKVIGG